MIVNLLRLGLLEKTKKHVEDDHYDVAMTRLGYMFVSLCQTYL
jgi:hypothetical protein